jgi:hypothetical protein
LPRLLAKLSLLIARAASAAACGSDAATTATTTTSSPTTTTSTAASRSDGASDAVPAPSRAARAAGNRLQALVAAYRPVSARVNFVVAAETLRVDASDSHAADAVLLERTGTVRIEIDRMRLILQRARPRVAALPVGSADEQHVQQLMLDAIDSRTAAIAALRRELNADANATVGDSEIEVLDDAWNGAWDDSLRSAREATTAMQDLRARLGLDPAREESIR